MKRRQAKKGQNLDEDNRIALCHFNKVKNLLSTLPRGSKVLDCGCGKGILSNILFENGCDVYACDIDKKIFEFKNIPFKYADLNKKLPYKSACFDCVICLEVIEHLENPWFLIREIHRVLNKKGLLIISSPNTSNCLGRIFFLLTGKIWLFKEHETDHINPISFWEIASILKKTGFSNTTLLEGVDIVSNIDMVTNIKNPVIKTIYFLIFKSWDLIHDLINKDNLKSKMLLKSFSYIIKAQK